MFDVGNDKKIDENDLQKVMGILFGVRMVEEDKKNLIAKVFEEADTGGKGYLDFDDI